MTASIDNAMMLVFVWDFDDTIVSVNTDTFAIERLAPDISRDYVNVQAMERKMSWTAIMDSALDLLSRRGFCAQDVLDTVIQAPFPPETRATIALIRDTPHAISAIISDANTMYIDAILKRWNLTQSFEAGIFTNPATIVATDTMGINRLKVSPFIDGTSRMHHNCRRCPENMCKGTLLGDLIEQYPRARFIYVGDGANDFCPCRLVPSNGLVLPKAGYPLHNKLTFTPVEARVQPWVTPGDLLELIRGILTETHFFSSGEMLR